MTGDSTGMRVACASAAGPCVAAMFTPAKAALPYGQITDLPGFSFRFDRYDPATCHDRTAPW